MDLDLKGKRVIITGGSRGIGLAIGRHFAREGATVATCARGSNTLDTALAELRTLGAEAYGSALDVRDEVALKSWFDEMAEAMGGVDIVVSNVSTRISPESPTWWQDSFAVDLMQHVSVMQLAKPYFEKAGGGSAIFIASIASVMTNLPPMEEAYGAMKAGLVNLVGQWAAKLAGKNIRINAVSPGPIFFLGGFWDQVGQANPAMLDRAAQLPAIGRLGTDEEVAKATVFLASPAASYITGANLRIDGGALKTANF